jgi:hypothetical protein
MKKQDLIQLFFKYTLQAQWNIDQIAKVSAELKRRRGRKK